uniref:Uncharacterized protein n=1 Tax=viral metagenome TaxID=1070528 RepID=A0A6M3M8D2_9ZZZZ
MKTNTSQSIRQLIRPKAPPKRQSFPHHVPFGRWLGALRSWILNVHKGTDSSQYLEDKADSFVMRVCKRRRSNDIRKRGIQRAAVRRRQTKRRRQRQTGKGLVR